MSTLYLFCDFPLPDLKSTLKCCVNDRQGAIDSMGGRTRRPPLYGAITREVLLPPTTWHPMIGNDNIGRLEMQSSEDGDEDDMLSRRRSTSIRTRAGSCEGHRGGPPDDSEQESVLETNPPDIVADTSCPLRSATLEFLGPL
jgi:hypothetical protein